MDFKIDDLVFGKVRGYPYWPAQIVRVDNETYKNVTKFEVRFFGTNEIAKININDICLYHENKLKYPLDSVAAKHRESYSIALKSIAKVFMSPGASKKIKTPTAKQTQGNSGVSTPFSPLSSRGDELVNQSQKTQTHTQTATTMNSTSNTLSCPKETMSSNKKSVDNTREDFQTQILKQELNHFKLENKSFQLTINLLKGDNEKLQQEIDHLKAFSQNCSHCYPPLLSPSKLNPWCRVKSKSPTTKHSTSTGILNNIECTNSFSILSQDIPAGNVPNKEVAYSKSFLGHVNSNCKIGNKSQTSHKVNKPRKKLVILADSHGKQLSNLIEQRAPFNVCSFVRSGAKFNQVTEEIEELAKGLDKQDYLMVIAGTNNMEATGISRLINDVQSLISKTEHTNLILASLPMRHDAPNLDLKISRVNVEIENIVAKKNHAKLLPLHLLPRHYFTTHGLHFNRRGKTDIAKTVARLLVETGSISEVQQPTDHPLLQSSGTSISTFSFLDAEDSEDADMLLTSYNSSAATSPTPITCTPSSPLQEKTIPVAAREARRGERLSGFSTHVSPTINLAVELSGTTVQCNTVANNLTKGKSTSTVPSNVPFLENVVKSVANVS